MKMLSLELEDILDGNMDKADKVNVSTIVGDFRSWIRLMWQMSVPL